MSIATENEMNRNTTAAEAYAAAAAKINEQIALLQKQLAEHAKRQQADARNWGYAGDLQHIAAQLGNLTGQP